MTRRPAVYCWKRAAVKGSRASAASSTASSSGVKKPGSYANPAGSCAASPKRSGVRAALRVLAAMPRDAGDRFRRGLALIQREIAEREDADQAFLAVDDGQTPHLDVRHVLRHVLGILIVVTVLHFGAHHVAHRR